MKFNQKSILRRFFCSYLLSTHDRPYHDTFAFSDVNFKNDESQLHFLIEMTQTLIQQFQTSLPEITEILHKTKQ